MFNPNTLRCHLSLIEPINHKLRRLFVVFSRIHKMRTGISAILFTTIPVPSVTITLISCVGHNTAVGVAPALFANTIERIHAEIIGLIGRPSLISVQYCSNDLLCQVWVAPRADWARRLREGSRRSTEGVHSNDCAAGISQ